MLATLPDDSDWAIRSENWISEALKLQPSRKVRERRKTTLILCGHGVSMRIEHGALVIRDGFTHYPQEQEAYRFFPSDLALPPRIMLLDGSGTLSFDVLSWLCEQGVALVRVKWNGEIAMAANGTGYAADPAKVQWQRETRADETKRLAFAAELIGRKLIASRQTLESHVAPSSTRDAAIGKIQTGIDRLKRETFLAISAIFAIEGECAGAYFAAWKSVAMRWTGTARRPIPEEWRRFTSRSSLLSGIKPKNRMASHPINAMLNYAYTVRQTQLQIDAVAHGYDPTIGIMHNRHQGSPAYILDLIEPERPKVDATVLALIDRHTFAADDFVIRRDGVCRLSPQLARTVAGLVLAR
jgi:CRISPR-associated protein Cas1